MSGRRESLRDELTRAIRIADFDAFADLGSEANRRLILLLFGSLCVIAAVVGPIAILPYADQLDVPVWSMLALNLSLLAAGLVAFRLPARTPMWILDAMGVAAVGFVTVSVVRSTGAVAGYTVLVYIWPAVGVSLFRTSRAVLVHFAVIATASGAVFGLDDSFSEPLFWWVAGLFILAVIWNTLGWTVRFIRELAVSERRARAQIEGAMVELQAEIDRKARFLASMSHELRTPLNAVIGFAEVIQRQLPGELNDRQQQYVSDIVDSGHHLLSLVDDTLEHAGDDASSSALELADVDFDIVVRDATVMIRERAREKNIDVDVRAADVGFVQLDARKVKQVLVNLLANAVKYSDRGDSVTITAVRHDDGLEVTVADTGPGISADALDTIFDPFCRGSEHDEGSGLGLGLTRELVEQHGGHIWVESEPGAGARFTFRIAGGGPHSNGHESIGATDRGAMPPSAAVLSSAALLARLRSAAIALGAACSFGFVVISDPEVNRAYLLVSALFCVGTAAGLTALRSFLARDETRARRTALAVNMTASLTTAVGVFVLGPVAPVAIAVWSAEAFFFRYADLTFGVRTSRIHTVYVGVLLAVALGVAPGNDAPVVQWLTGVGTLAVCAFHVGWLMDRLRMLVEAEQAAASAASRVVVELGEVSRHKSRFLTGMSHELRTPLNAVIGFAAVLDRELAGPLNDRQRQYVNDIAEAGRHLLDLINNVLDLARIEAGRLEVELAPVAVDDVIDRAIAEARERAGASAPRLERVDRVGPTVLADRDRLGVAVTALLANAFKFSPADGRVTIAATRDGEHGVIIVRDTGPGIDPSEHEAIFEPFHQGERDPRRAAEGAGLGLALARRLVELQGGTLRVESASGAGACFTITLATAAVDRLPSTTEAATAAHERGVMT